MLIAATAAAQTALPYGQAGPAYAPAGPPNGYAPGPPIAAGNPFGDQPVVGTPYSPAMAPPGPTLSDRAFGVAPPAARPGDYPSAEPFPTGPVFDPPSAIPVFESHPLKGNSLNGDPDTTWEAGFTARGYALYDQRITWSGMEASFGAEGVLTGIVRHRWDDWTTSVEGEFFLNQPYDGNRLLNTPELESYAADFNVDPFQISKLAVRAQRGDLTFVIGKIETPFGRTYFPIFTNSFMDAPFIRTEVIGFRETGALVHYHSGLLVVDAGAVNGGTDRATNSTPSVVARVGLEDMPHWAVGASIKWGNGTGSDVEKEYDNHAGVDFMVRWSCWTFSGEAVYDQYGFLRPFNPDDITWYRSIYYRDVFSGQLDTPICGCGWYLNLGYEQGPWTVALNYGEYYPGQIGNPQQDITNRRGIVKAAYALTPHLRPYGMYMAETEGYTAQDGRPRGGNVVLSGLEYAF